ncbi:conserved Plasmodium protein, unknown function [Plasmodium malariae]|uniref:Uncharacterized protein n=1 Tax=Plasmodium malariae TaxID=5858 RepID=A0A1A8WE08_PLAMA|nr:conserved Plasmodium protein, unknown function [Plasmodium malariae]SBS90005.1 hypothetical protein PMALA_028220 [Plasmodium malariae]SCP03142.1 conserved Plasmodium protein, unknown function [Plasmodium malariae]
MNTYLHKKNVGSKYYHIKSKHFFNNYKYVKHFSYAPIPKRVGFMKPAFKLNRKAQTYIVNVQWLKSSNTEEVQKLCNNIKKDANLFNSYEIIDLIYYLSKISNKNVYLTIEPLLFHFFRKYNTSVNLNGISIHRLLRVLTEYQDLVYREWIYSIAKIISKKHAHIPMRDIQLILDDLALFYDFQIHCHIIPFYNTIINRIHELEVKRLPFLIHVIGRIGCNNKNLLDILYNTLKKNISKNELYRSDFSGLLLRGLANLKIKPNKNILYQLYKPVKDDINYTNIKYISWCADGFSRLNYFHPLPLLVNQILKMKEKISQLELNDFSSILNCIQAYILIKQYDTYNMKTINSNERNIHSDFKNMKKSYHNDQKGSQQHSRLFVCYRASHKLECHQDDHNRLKYSASNADINNYYNNNTKICGKNIKCSLQTAYEKDDNLCTSEAFNLNQQKLRHTENLGKMHCSTEHKEINLLREECYDSAASKQGDENKESVGGGKKGNTNCNTSSYTTLESKESSQHCNEDYSRSIAKEKYLNEIHPTYDINDNLISMEELYDIYRKLENIILEKITESIYSSTPPYRVIMFELLTRLFRFYKKPIDLIVNMNTHRYDTSLLLKYTNSLSLIISNKTSRIMSSSQLSFYVNQYHISNEFFFGNISNFEICAGEDSLNIEKLNTKRENQNVQNNLYKYIKEEQTEKKSEREQFVEKSEIYCLEGTDEHLLDEKNAHLNVNIPLPKIFKNFLHSIFFRTPALGGRTIMLLLIALVRLNFGEREKSEYLNKMDTYILPFSKAKEIYRPLTNCIIREIIRKLETFNSEELIICAMCLNELDALDLNGELFPLLIDRFFNLYNNNYMSNDQVSQLKGLFHFWHTKRRNIIVNYLTFTSIKHFKSFILA